MADLLQSPTQGVQLNDPPVRPPDSVQRRSVIDLGAGRPPGGMEIQDPVIKIMQHMGRSRAALLELAGDLPQLSSGIQQFLQGLEQVVPQFVADMAAGQQPGMGSPGAGAVANQAPTAPPIGTAP